MLTEFIGGLGEDDDRPALPRVTRGDLARLIRGYAVALAAEGLGPGDTVALAVRPGARSLATLLAAYHLGLRIAVVDPTAGPDIVRARLRLAEPRLVLADAAAQAVAGWAAPLARRAHLALPDLSSIAPVKTIGHRLPGSAPALPIRQGQLPRPYDGEGDAVVVFTSGTTSNPRAVVHTRSSISAGMTAVRDLVRPEPGRPVLGGTFFVLLPSLASGAPVAAPTKRNLRRLRPQAVYLTPPQLRAALASGCRFDGSRVYSGSAPVSASLLSAVRRAGAHEAWGVYALTEVFPAAAVESTTKTSFTADGDLVGDLLPGVEARVDETGQVLLAGPTAANRYLGEPPFEWVATGDIGHVEGRRVVLGGRAKDMILRNAENIYPGLYEPTLHVPGVELALLVGIPAVDGDEQVIAVVQTATGASTADVHAALQKPLARMGSARPDAVVFARIPLSGRSQKPDRAATSQLAAALAPSPAPSPALDPAPNPAPTPAAAADPTPGPIADPTPGHAANQAPGPTADPTPGHAADPAPGPTADPVPGHAANQAPGPTADPTPGHAANQAPGPTADPTPGHAADPAPGPAANPAFAPAADPAPGPAANSTPGDAANPAFTPAADPQPGHAPDLTADPAPDPAATELSTGQAGPLRLSTGDQPAIPKPRNLDLDHAHDPAPGWAGEAAAAPKNDPTGKTAVPDDSPTDGSSPVPRQRERNDHPDQAAETASRSPDRAAPPPPDPASPPGAKP